MKKACDYVYVGGLRLPSNQVIVDITHPDGRVEQVGVAAKSRGRNAGYRSLKDLEALVRSGAQLTASVYVEGEKVSESLPFDPSSSRGRRGRRARSTTTPTPIGGVSRSSDGKVDPRVFDVALRGISYGGSSEVSAQNVRQMHWLLFSRGGEQRLLETLRSNAGDSAAQERRILAVRGIADMITADKRFVEERPDVMAALWATAVGREAAATAVSLGYAPEIARLEYMTSPSTDTPGRLREHTVMVLFAIARTEDLDTLAAVAATGEERFALAAYKRMDALTGGSSASVLEAALATGLPFESARGFLSQGVDTVDRMLLLRNIGLPVTDVRTYESAGVDRFSDMLLLARRGIDADLTRRYAESGLTGSFGRLSGHELLELRAAKITPEQAQAYAAAGHAKIVLVQALIQRGVTSQGATEYASAGVRSTDEVLELSRAAVTPARCSEYVAAGVTSPQHMIALSRSRVHPAAARAFAELGFSTDETLRLAAAGITTERHDNDAPRNPTPASAYLPEYVKFGFSDVSEIIELSLTGVTPTTARVYRVAGVAEVKDICRLHNFGVSEHDVLKQVDAGASVRSVIDGATPKDLGSFLAATDLIHQTAERLVANPEDAAAATVLARFEDLDRYGRVESLTDAQYSLLDNLRHLQKLLHRVHASDPISREEAAADLRSTLRHILVLTGPSPARD